MNCSFYTLFCVCLLFLDDVNSEINFLDPLKLMYDQSTFHPRVKMDPTMKTAWTNMSACPAEESEFKALKTLYPNARCIVPFPFTEPRPQHCSSEVRPRIAYDSECDEGAKLYAFRYDVCFRNEDKQEKLYPTDVYSVCYNETQTETLYTKHVISSVESMKTDLPQEFIKNLQTAPADDFKHDLKNLADIYKIMDKITNDHLIPQMLVSPIDLEPNFARDANFHYLNTRPQWDSLHLLWETINDSIWTYINTENRDAEIYTGTSGILEIEDTKYVYKIDQLDVTVPLIWWKLITTNDKKAIVIVLYNLPFESKMEHIHRVCHHNICKKSNLSGNGFTSEYIQCCKPEDKVLKFLGFNEQHPKYELLKFEQDNDEKNTFDTIVDAMKYVLNM